MYNNKNNQNFSNEYKPLFQGQFNNIEPNNNEIENNYITTENPIVINQTLENNNSLEEPPELGPIKNISEAIYHQPATLDVLGPMNIMPENFDNVPLQNDTQIDALDNYDSRKQFEPELPEYNNINTDLNNFSNIQNYEPTNEVYSNEEIPSSYEMPDMPNMYNNESPEIPEIPDISSIYDNNMEKETEINKEEEAEDENTSDLELPSEESKKEEENAEVNNEEDLLEIIDEEQTDEQNETSINSEKEEKPLLRGHVDEIRDYVENLKIKGIDASIEEYDFEHMYQLIIKIKK